MMIIKCTACRRALSTPEIANLETVNGVYCSRCRTDIDRYAVGGSHSFDVTYVCDIALMMLAIAAVIAAGFVLGLMIVMGAALICDVF